MSAGRLDRQGMLLYVAVALAIGFVDFRVRPGSLQAYPVTHYIPGVVAGTYGAPAIYRVLTPFLVDVIARVTGSDMLVAFLATRLVFIYVALVALHAYMRQFYSPAASVGAVLGVAALLPLTFTNGWANPDTFPELALFTLGCLAVARGNDLLFLVVLVLATLNRETAAFLVVLWGCVRLPGRWSRADIAKCSGFALTWLGIYAGLRWYRGFQSYQYWMFWDNVDTLKPVGPGYDFYRRVFGYFWLALLAVPSWLAIRASRMPDTPTFARRALPVVGAVVVVSFLISKIIEARIFMPIFPLLLPLVVRAFAEPTTQE
jgi:hypothetical protein